MKKHFLLLLALLILALPSFCQVVKTGEGMILFHGLIMDGGTEVPLPNSQIFINKSFTSISDNEGKFAFYVNRHDTVVFSTLGYKSIVLHISDTLQGKEFIAGIYMQTDTVNIGEVIIVPRMTSLRSELLRPQAGASTQLENAKNNLAISAYQGRVNQSKLGDPAMNYEMLRQKQKADAYSKGQIPPDKILGLSPLLLIPAAYLLINGLPEKPSPLKPRLTDQEVESIHRKYIESLKKDK
jgi:hypothetical protein